MANYFNTQHFLLDATKRLGVVSDTKDIRVVQDFLNHMLDNMDDYKGRDVDNFVKMAMRIVSEKTIELT